MFSKTRSGETSREKIRMVRAVLLDTPKPFQFQFKFQFVHFLPYSSVSNFYRIFVHLPGLQKLFSQVSN